MKIYKKNNKAVAVLFVSVLILALFIVLGAQFMSRSNNELLITNLNLSRQSAIYSLEEAIRSSQRQLQSRVENHLRLVGNNDFSSYAVSEDMALQLLQDDILVPEFSTLQIGQWVELNEKFERKIDITAELPILTSSQSTLFRYQYRIRARMTDNFRDSNKQVNLLAHDSGSFSFELASASLTRWALARMDPRLPHGQVVYFSGERPGPPAVPRQVYNGDVIVNGRLFVTGNPKFLGRVTSIIPNDLFLNDPVFGNPDPYIADPDRVGEPEFLDGVESLVECDDAGEPSGQCDGHANPFHAPLDPSGKVQLGNIIRSSVGDQAPNALQDPDESGIDNMYLRQELQYYQAPGGSSVLTPGSADLPDDIYIPVTGSSAIKGGAYVSGNIDHLGFDVLSSGDTGANVTHFNEMAGFLSGCDKFQKITIEQATKKKEIYSTAKECSESKTFVFDLGSSTPSVLEGRFEGNIYSSGGNERMGAETVATTPDSATRPAIAKDYKITVGSNLTTKISNHLEYEDSVYVSTNSEGDPEYDPHYFNYHGVVKASDVVSNPYNEELNAQGKRKTSGDVQALMPRDSRTMLGIVSAANVMLKYEPIAGSPVDGQNNAPTNLNLHASVFAASTRNVGAGPCSRPVIAPNNVDCGFGYEAIDLEVMGSPPGSNIPHRGNLKVLGTIIENRHQGTFWRNPGNPDGGYRMRLTYDRRLMSDGLSTFPVSNLSMVRHNFLGLNAPQISSLDH
jgi:hypothetical protein